MPLLPVADPDFKIVKSICHSFGTGFCFSVDNPFYNGHYATAGEAIEAAKLKRTPTDTGSVT